jgi:hypothetical protein
MASSAESYFILKDDMRIESAQGVIITPQETPTGYVVVQLSSDKKKYLAHKSKSALERVVLPPNVYIAQLCVRSLNDPSDTSQTTGNISFSVKYDGGYTIYNIVGSRIQHEHTIRQAIIHNLANGINVHTKYEDLQNLLDERYPGIHRDIFDGIALHIHDMRVDVFMRAMMTRHAENGTLTEADMTKYINEALVAAEHPPVANTLVAVHAKTTDNNIKAKSPPVIKAKSPPVIKAKDPPGRLAWDTSTIIPVPKRGGNPLIDAGAAIFERDDADIHKKPRRTYTVPAIAKKTWPIADRTYAPIFYMISGIRECRTALLNSTMPDRENPQTSTTPIVTANMYRLCMFIHDLVDLQADFGTIVPAAITELERILAGATTPMLKLTQIFAALKLTNPSYIISDKPDLADSANTVADSADIVVMCAYITDDTYTDVDHSLEYKGAECYPILIDDKYKYPPVAGYIYKKQIYAAAIQPHLH